MNVIQIGVIHYTNRLLAICLDLSPRIGDKRLPKVKIQRLFDRLFDLIEKKGQVSQVEERAWYVLMICADIFQLQKSERLSCVYAWCGTICPEWNLQKLDREDSACLLLAELIPHFKHSRKRELLEGLEVRVWDDLLKNWNPKAIPKIKLAEALHKALY